MGLVQGEWPTSERHVDQAFGLLAMAHRAVRGKIELFGLDTLVNMIGAAGLHVEMRVSDAA